LSVALFGVPAAATTLGVSAASSTSAPSFAATRNYRVGGDPTAVAIGDLNGDRKLDLAVVNYSWPSVSVLTNRGDGSFRAARNFATGRQWQDLPVDLAIGDLTGDGKPDLAVANAVTKGRGVILFVNKGSGTFRAERRFVTAVQPEAVAIGELNGDKKPDLVAVSHDAAAVSVLLNKGGGRFAAKVDYRTGAGPGSIAIGDLTGDHKPDLVTANENVRTVSLHVNKGDGTFESKRDFRTGRVPRAVAIGDLNADGKPDLAAVNTWGGGTISVLTNSGGGSFEPRRDFPTGRFADAVMIADLNGDRRPDLANLDDGRNSISVLVNSGDGNFEPRLDYAAGGSPTSLARGDLNGDGKVDLATAYHRPVDGVGVLLARPGLCTVQDVRVMTVEEAKRMLARANCRLARSAAPTRSVSRTVSSSRRSPSPGRCCRSLARSTFSSAAARGLNGDANPARGRIRRLPLPVRRECIAGRASQLPSVAPVAPHRPELASA
jgi:hypothetical protein